MIDRPHKAARVTGRALSSAQKNDADDETGPGWYASTWDLQQGLEVSEGLPADAAPLEELMAYLLTQQPSDAALTLAPLDVFEPARTSASADAGPPLNPRRHRPRVP